MTSQMTNPLIEGFINVLSFPNILYGIAGTLIAMIISFMPGIGMIGVASIFLLISAYWPTEQTLVFFGAIVGGATFMGSVTGILFNIPGSTPSAAILLDGYPLAQKGYPKKALAASATASAVGSVFGVLVLLTILPFVKNYLLLIGPFEKVLIAIWGILCVTLVTKSTILLSIWVIFLGLFLATIGLDLDTGTTRMTFGIEILNDGIDPIIFMLGFFSISEILGWRQNSLRGKSHHYQPHPNDRIFDGIKAVFFYKKLTLQSSIVGTIVGIIPGIGGTVASMISYAFASRIKDENQFGQGDIRGIIAPEAAVDAKDGGSLLPAILLGLPGSEIGIILIGVFTIHGLVPGNTMLTSQLSLTHTLIIALLFSNLLTSLLGILLINQFVKLKNLNVKLIAIPTILIICFITYDLKESWIDLILLFFFGLLGLLFQKFNLPKIPFIISFVLGKFIESNFLVSSKLIEASNILIIERSLSIALVILIIICLLTLLPTRKKISINQDLPPYLLILATLLISFMGFTDLITNKEASAYSWIIYSGSVIFTFLILTIKLRNKKLN